jgi:hypothetical protein
VNQDSAGIHPCVPCPSRACHVGLEAAVSAAAAAAATTGCSPLVLTIQHSQHTFTKSLLLPAALAPCHVITQGRRWQRHKPYKWI